MDCWLVWKDLGTNDVLSKFWCRYWQYHTTIPLFSEAVVVLQHLQDCAPDVLWVCSQFCGVMEQWAEGWRHQQIKQTDRPAITCKWFPRQGGISITWRIGQILESEPDRLYHDAPQEILPACSHLTVQLLTLTVRLSRLTLVSLVSNNYSCALINISTFP